MIRPGAPAGRLRIIALVALAASLAACVERGDFGRVKPSVWNDAVGVTGSVAETVRGEAVSRFGFTDDETLLRSQAWRFLVPAHDAAHGARVLAELVATRVLPADLAEPDRHAYYLALESTRDRSPTPLYRRLSEDAAADSHLVAPFVDTALRVLTADRVRVRTLAVAEAPTAAEIDSARARIVENRCLVAWVASAAGFRSASYAYALDRLTIASPQPEAVAAGRAVSRLALARTSLERLGGGALPAACLPDLPPLPAAVIAKG